MILMLTGMLGGRYISTYVPVINVYIAKVLNCAELNKTSGLSTIEELPKLLEKKCLETWSTGEDVPDV